MQHKQRMDAGSRGTSSTACAVVLLLHLTNCADIDSDTAGGGASSTTSGSTASSADDRQPSLPVFGACDLSTCCPPGTEWVDGDCPLPDLAIIAPRIAETAHVIAFELGGNSCELEEGCVGADGNRTLLTFEVAIANLGVGDLVLGAPDDNPLFEYSPCHDHFHFSGFATYRLLDGTDTEVGVGHKQAFCLRDNFPVFPSETGEPVYTCEHQGIQKGWIDVYAAELPCQWVDVTNVPPGTYQLVVEVNPDHTLAELDYTNNIATVTVTIPFNSCPLGCDPVDGTCCLPDNPCDLADNGRCECGAFFDWDAADCGNCIPNLPNCFSHSTCPAGCTENLPACCQPDNPCQLQLNSMCDCEGVFDWDTADCHHCDSTEPYCPINSCPNGCTTQSDSPACCTADNPCGWTTDGFCDCSGIWPWDVEDCASCKTADPACP